MKHGIGYIVGNVGVKAFKFHQEQRVSCASEMGLSLTYIFPYLVIGIWKFCLHDIHKDILFLHY